MFVKEKHIELSDGDTCIVSNDKCPLIEELAKELNIVIEFEKGKSIPCCNCQAWLKESINTMCPYYYGYINSLEKGEFFDCRIYEEFTGKGIIK